MIVDTNSLSAYADGVSQAVLAIDSADSIELPAIALGEYMFGIEGSRHAQRYATWLSQFLRLTLVLPVTEETARHYAIARAELKTAGTPIPVNDLWIAALARQHRMPILSQDRHFDSVRGVKRISW